MTNIATMTSEKNYEAVHGQTSEETPLKIQPEQVVSVKIRHTLPPAKVLALLHAVDKNKAATQGTPVIHFMGSHKSAGADVVAFESAYASALSGKRVLFIDTNGSSSDVIRQIRGKIALPLNIPANDNADDVTSIVNVQGTSLFFGIFNKYEENHAFFLDGGAHQNILDKLRGIFDLIVVYSESGLSNPLATILSGLADTSIIVAEEGRTRIPLIKDLRRLITLHGGHVAGVVLNKCRFFIPPFIYNALFS